MKKIRKFFKNYLKIIKNIWYWIFLIFITLTCENSHPVITVVLIAVFIPPVVMWINRQWKRERNDFKKITETSK